MKRLTTPEAIKAYRDGERIGIEFTGFFDHYGNTRTMTEFRELKKGLEYLTADGTLIKTDCFMQAIRTECGFIGTWIFYGAEKIYHAFYKF